MAGSEDATSTNEEDTPLELTKSVELARVGLADEGLFDMLGRWFDSGAVLTADISAIHTDAVAAEHRHRFGWTAAGDFADLPSG
jgi:hypothetical protein